MPISSDPERLERAQQLGITLHKSSHRRRGQRYDATSYHPGYQASLFFWGEQVDPPSLTALLRFQPDQAYRKGEVRFVSRSTGAEVRAKTGSWHYGTTPADAGGRSIDDHIDFLLNLLEAAGPALVDHVRENRLRVEIVPFWNEMTDSDAYQFAPERLERARRLGITLHKSPHF